MVAGVPILSRCSASAGGQAESCTGSPREGRGLRQRGRKLLPDVVKGLCSDARAFAYLFVDTFASTSTSAYIHIHMGMYACVHVERDRKRGEMAF